MRLTEIRSSLCADNLRLSSPSRHSCMPDRQTEINAPNSTSQSEGSKTVRVAHPLSTRCLRLCLTICLSHLYLITHTHIATNHAFLHMHTSHTWTRTYTFILKQNCLPVCLFTVHLSFKVNRPHLNYLLIQYTQKDAKHDPFFRMTMH